LKAFIAERHRMPKVTEVYCGVNIGSWYAAQKGLLQSDDYPAERRAKIESLGPDVVIFEIVERSIGHLPYVAWNVNA